MRSFLRLLESDMVLEMIRCCVQHGSIRFWIDLVPSSKESMYEVVNMAELRAQQVC